ncbi:MAG: type IV pilus twitching motility protein PilT, partial [Solirubrobacteraceae bacterium]|nr:type IV pilus twitching motility protein PilT [Solirubrobacteraceae bacterium]
MADHDRFDIEQALRALVESGGSDLHLKVGLPPMMRLHGDLVPFDGAPPLTSDDTRQAARSVIVDPSKYEEFADEHEVDLSYSIAGSGRYRFNIFMQRGSISIVARAIPEEISPLATLSLPEAIRELAEEERGMVLVTGTTGSGKSTTLAAMINHINEEMSKHVITVEDPIEFVHGDKRSVVNQREVGLDTKSFGQALRRILRQDPDVILVGEMRDQETVHTALSAAETGHLVFSTLHTVDAPETINRIIDFFPPHQQQQVRAMIAGTLKGIISQRLVKSKDGGRVAVCEILRMTGRVRDMIMDPDQTGRLGEIIEEGGYYGMQTFDQALFTHLQAGRISVENAMLASTTPHDLKLLLAADGRKGTTMADVDEAASVSGETPQAAAGTPAAPAGPAIPVPSPEEEARMASYAMGGADEAPPSYGGATVADYSGGLAGYGGTAGEAYATTPAYGEPAAYGQAPAAPVAPTAPAAHAYAAPPAAPAAYGAEPAAYGAEPAAYGADPAAYGAPPAYGAETPG